MKFFIGKLMILPHLGVQETSFVETMSIKSLFGNPIENASLGYSNSVPCTIKSPWLE